jgi:hypothetical protein
MGVDFTGFATVRAVANGVVAHVGYRAGWEPGGNMVWINHDGYLSRSLHLVTNSQTVAVGQAVVAGQPLATMGNTGIGSGVHLHLEIAPGGGGQVDPVPYLQNLINANTPDPEPVPKEDDMAYPITCNGRAYLVAPGYIKSLNTQPDADLTRNIVSATDTWIALTETQFHGQLSSFGIPSSVVNLATGAVTNAETGLPEGGGVWTWARLAVVNTNRILAKL